MTPKRYIFAKYSQGEFKDGNDLKDMLRYDGAFIAEEGPIKNVVAFVMFKTKTGDLYGKVTEARWKSMGISLQPITAEKEIVELHDLLHANPTSWVTFRRCPTPRMNEAPLLPFTFRDYLLVKDLRKIENESNIRGGLDICRKCGSPEGKHLERCPEKI